MQQQQQPPTTNNNNNSLILMEHINFKIPYSPPPIPILQQFFVQLLGCPECPTGRLQVATNTNKEKSIVAVNQDKQMHVNLGLSQIHFEWCTGDGIPYTKPQHLRGYVTL